MNLLPWTIGVAAIGALLCCLVPNRARLPHWIALCSTVLIILLGAAAVARTNGADMGWRTLVRTPWIPSMGVEFHLAADGISLALVLLTGVASLAAVLFSWNVERKPGAFFALVLALVAGVLGVFLSADLFLLFVCYEIAIVPKYFLIAVWGGADRERAAMKLALYSFVGSAMVLVGIIATHVLSGTGSFDLQTLVDADIAAGSQSWLFPLVFIGFGILAGLWPFHNWAPTGHVAAPTAASMLLAGVVMKLGAYGCLRVALPLYPAGADEWQMPLAWLSIGGILLGGLVALAQRDFKFVIGYSSVSHMGFVMLGLVTLTDIGLAGGVFQMVSHGVIAGLLFGIVGRVVYERAHTRDLDVLKGMGLGRLMPFAATAFVLAGLASMGMPGFSGFIAECSVLVGTWKAFPVLALLAAVGILFAAAYTLRATVLAFFHDAAPAAHGEDGHADHGDVATPVSIPEKLGIFMLLGIALYLGLFPAKVMGWIEASLYSPLMSGIFSMKGH